ncbi:MAG: sigma-54-dependent Fis family transcriptional regulator, partial [Armatimonadetes bacterium]|nr:sigma-54-dependent Fis family transcriptional regulator [Armatimonadota bacterium]
AFNEEDLQLIAAVGNLGGLALESALRFGALEAENRRLREEIDLEHDMVGESAAMRRVYRFVAKVAPTDSTVLITGESGTGKELVARAIHRNSPRADRPFLAINCAALAESLLESELFGHERGAFTGAIARKQGKFELAGSGSIFLDEVAELSPKLQAKLLRVLQEREFERVGGARPIRMSARVIAATNHDLERAVSDGTFRGDLYFRLNVVSIEMPPLRERRQDIPLLANYFVAATAKRLGRRVAGLSSEARRRFLHYEWPGNVRELENAVERAVVLGVSDYVLAEDLPEAIAEAAATTPGDSDGYQTAVREAKRKIILTAIDDAGGSQSRAAAALGVTPAYLSRLIRNLDLKGEVESRRR